MISSVLGPRGSHGFLVVLLSMCKRILIFFVRMGMDERVYKIKALHTGTPLASDANLDLMQKLLGSMLTQPFKRGA